MRFFDNISVEDSLHDSGYGSGGPCIRRKDRVITLLTRRLRSTCERDQVDDFDGDVNSLVGVFFRCSSVSSLEHFVASVSPVFKMM